MTDAARIARRIRELDDRFEKQKRWPAGNPKGGQFAPNAGGSSGAYSQKFPGMTKPVQSPKIIAPQYGMPKPKGFFSSLFPGPDEPSVPKGPPPGWKPHPKAGDKGEEIAIHYPSKATGTETWKDPSVVATFTPGSPTPAELHGVPLRPWKAPTTLDGWNAVEGQNPRIDAEHPFEPTEKKSVGAGVIVREPDGRVWLTSPTNSFGGYKNTFPKGTVEKGLSLQASAIKEAYEETGLKVRIVGILGDYERTTSKARYYIAERVGGTPADMGWESQAIRLAPQRALKKILNMPVDKGIADDFMGEQLLKAFDKAKSGRRGKFNADQPRWPAGSPLGGQWKKMGAGGITLPPTLAGGLGGKNPQYQKKADAAHALAQAGSISKLLDMGVDLDKKVTANAAAGAKSSHVKWTAQLHQYVGQLANDLAAGPKAQASADALTGPIKLSSLAPVGTKPGGSNPGGMYAINGEKWLVKGNLKLQQGAVDQKTSDNRAKNEVLAAHLINAVSHGGAPDMQLVDLGKEYGGGLGVASKMVGASGFNPSNAAHVAAIQKDYALHAWLGNYDVLGMGYDNTVISPSGKAVNIDPGGAILFRAQGLPKLAFDKDAPEWETMRNTTSEQKAIFGKMTASQLQDSAKALASIDDATIKKLVDTYGPGDAKAKADLADKLISRRDAILTKAGLKSDTASIGTAAVHVATPVAPPTPPVIAQAAAIAGSPSSSFAKPTFNTGFAGPDGYYAGLADKAEALHASGDLAGLKGLATKKNGSSAWPTGTANGKKMASYHAALVADLEKAQPAAIVAVATGAAKVTDSSGKQWQATNGVLNPVKSASALTPQQLKPILSSVIPDDKVDEVLNSASQGKTAVGWTHVSEVAIAALNGDTNGVRAKIGMGASPAASVANKVMQAINSAGAAPAAPSIASGPTPVPKAAVQAILAGHLADSSKVGEIVRAAARGETIGGYNILGGMAIFALQGDKASLEDYHAAPGSFQEGIKNSLLLAMSAMPVQPSATQAAAATVQAASTAQLNAATAAMPNFEKAKLPDTNTNAASHNSKVSAIASLAGSGDVKGLLALNYGTNTYGKKQAQLANDALAALGSVHKVTPGQKTNSHPALVGGTVQSPAAAAVKPVAAPKPAPAAPVPVHKIPDPPDFTNWKGPGQGLSSKPAVNAQNAQISKEIKALGDKLDVAGLKALTFEMLDPATGQSLGKTALVTQHPSQHIKAYLTDVIDAVQNPYVPPKVMSARELAKVPDLIKGVLAAVGDVAALPHESTGKKIGRYALLGSVNGKPFDGYPPEKKSPQMGNLDVKGLYAQSKSNFNALSQIEQKAIRDYTGGGYQSQNNALTGKGNNMSSHSIEGLKKAAVPLPEGTTLSRKFTFKEDHSVNVDKLIQSVGSVVKDFGIISTSTNPDVWGGDVHLHITTAPGVKGLYVANNPSGGGGSISLHPGENEIILPHGTKFYVKSVKKGGEIKDKTGSWGKKQGASVLVELVALPDLS